MLHWRRPGSVWAIDFSEAACAIDSDYPYLLAVRDLASHSSLLWLPVKEMTAEVMVAALTDLFTVQGAPLLRKADTCRAFPVDALRDRVSIERAMRQFVPTTGTDDG